MVNEVRSHPLSALRNQSIENWSFRRAWGKAPGWIISAIGQLVVSFHSHVLAITLS